MNLAGRERVKELLSRAALLPAADRAAFVQREAGDDAEIAAEAVDLLQTLEDPGFLVAPTGAGFASAFAEPRSGEGAGSRIGRYKLLQLIGEGGFGAVFMADQTEPVHRRVALKIIKAGMDTRQVIARFEAERQALAMMDHPNIARVLDAGATESGRPYFVMELVRGESVTRYCDREKLSVPQRLELFRDICHAVEHAHQKGVIHRDIKPSNVLVSVADGQPLPKVIDFGIAKATAAPLTDKTLFTEMHQLIGTPEYMSPEQTEIHGVDIDTRSDIYSLGVLLYELLVGTTPLDRGRLRATPLAEMQRIIREEEAPRPSQRLATLASSSGAGRLEVAAGPEREPASSAMDIARCRRSEPATLTRALRGDLDWIVMKCLEKDRRRRYGTASALADEVGRYLRREPVLARSPSAGYQIRKFVQRRKGSVLAAFAITGVAVVGLTATLLQARRANREAEQTHAVNEFMREILTSVQPGNRGADVRLVEVLGSASVSAGERFAGHPTQEATVRDLLAEVYSNLNQCRESKAERRRAVALWSAALGPDSPQTLISEAGLARTLIALEERTEAGAILTEVLPRLERVLGPDHPGTLMTRKGLADVYTLHRRYDEARALLTELRAHPVLAEDDASQIEILISLIRIDKSLQYSTSAHGPSPDITRRLEELAAECAERALRRFGPGAPLTLETQLWQAEFQCDSGRYQAAARTARALLDATTEAFGDCHQIRLDAMDVLADALAGLGDEHEPAELRLRKIECMRQKVDPASPILLAAISESLDFLSRAGRATEGEALARELLAALRSYGGGHDLIDLTAEFYVAHFISMQGRFDEADALYPPLLSRIPHLTKGGTVQAQILYGSHLVRRGRYEEAERTLLAVVEITGDPRRGVGGHVYPDNLLVEFVALYDAWGKPEQADEYRRLQSEVLGPSAPSGPE
ncbi:MAG: Serine/threonine-protein kinase PknD [Phycisphaerae bacterium]|nr:Serine/threonine-protein kinase PknD [Phycisphaerae bacterium]